MPRRALRCVVDLTVHAVSAPGVWLPSKEDVYISISMLGQYRNTRNLASVFPLIIHEKFQFEKTYYTALDPSQVADLLEDELVIFELIQLSEYTEGAVRLASFSTNARDFLYPYPSLAPIYSSTDREILMSRTVAFPGISPKLEFATKTVIKESLSPEYDALEDALEQERERMAFGKTRRSPTRRPRSASFSRRPAEIIPDDTIDPRPPFVVRKLDQNLIGRLPGGGPDKHAKSKQKKPTRIPLASSDDELYLDLPPKSQYHLEKVIREPLRDPLPVFKPRFSTTDDEDAEVAELTSRTASYYRLRPRSASPLLYRSSFEDRYGAYSPSYYSSIAERVSSAIERSRRLERLARLYPPYRPSLSLDRTYLPRYVRYNDDLLDLEIATKVAKSRSPTTSLVHLDRGLYWTEQAAALSGKTHREIFDRNLSKIYNRLYRNARAIEAQKA